MQLKLKVVRDGAPKETAVMLTAPQAAVVGRDYEADVSFPKDPKISGRHFRLFSRDGVWRLEDLGSTNGTQVNGRKVSNCVLEDGDTVQVGNTVLLIDIDGPGTASATTSGAFRSSWELDGEESHIAMARLGRLGVPFQEEVYQESLQLYQGELKSIAPKIDFLLPAKFVQTLRQSSKFKPWLIADFKKLGGGIPEPFLESCLPIVDWIGGPDIALSFPVLIPLIDRPHEEWAATLNEGWDQDALVVVFSRKPAEELLAHWRKQARGRAGGMVGIFWPSILGSLLAYNSIGKTLLEELDGLLIEVSDLPGHWQLWTPKPRLGELKRLGFRSSNETSSELAGEIKT